MPVHLGFCACPDGASARRIAGSNELPEILAVGASAGLLAWVATETREET